jgi:hypothetical protein
VLAFLSKEEDRMWSNPLGYIREAVVKHRLSRLCPSVEYSEVNLRGDGVLRRGFLRKLIGGVLGFAGVAAFSGKASAHALDDTALPAGRGARIPYAMAHRNTAPINVHTNSAERHVDVQGPTGHADFTRPHMESHINSPGYSDTSDEKKAEPPKPIKPGEEPTTPKKSGEEPTKKKG